MKLVGFSSRLLLVKMAVSSSLRVVMVEKSDLEDEKLMDGCKALLVG